MRIRAASPSEFADGFHFQQSLLVEIQKRVSTYTNGRVMPSLMTINLILGVLYISGNIRESKQDNSIPYVKGE